ncbi:MAG: lamin tail domain-containing protein, partial [Planctomycetota bacterium]
MPGFIKNSLLVPILILCLAGSVYAKCPLGDLNRDCRVDLLDMHVLAEQWLEPPEKPADLNGDDSVNIRDLALMAMNWNQAGIPLAINELMASNSSSIPDPQGEFDDWIEIYNFGTDAIDIGGMYLTDNLSVPNKWQIPGNSPAATTIPAGGYLLIWADNEIAEAGLHANFKLDAGGEEIALFYNDGITLIDSIIFPDQTVDISYGRFPDGDNNHRFFAVPSPKAQNNDAYSGEVSDTQFSHDRGFYDTPFSLTIAADTKGAAIYYTLDGSEPYKLGGRFPNGIVYTGPISISKTT